MKTQTEKETRDAYISCIKNYLTGRRYYENKDYAKAKVHFDITVKTFSDIAEFMLTRVELCCAISISEKAEIGSLVCARKMYVIDESAKLL